VLAGRFTEEGTVTYGRDLVAFTFRYELEASGPDAEAEADAAVAGELKSLERYGWGYRELRTIAAVVPSPRRR